MADQPQGESSNQLIVALAIVGVIGLIAMGLIIGGMVTNQWVLTLGGLGSIVTGLFTALNAPSGISAVLKAAAKPNEPTP